MRPNAATLPVLVRRSIDKSNGKLVLVIDDDPFVLDGMDGILRSWGCRVITADTDTKALDILSDEDRAPDLIISDYYLPNGTTGIEIIERLRTAFAVQIPAFLVSGDIDTAPLDKARAHGFHLLHKPVDPMALRAMFQQTLRRQQAAPSLTAPAKANAAL